MITTCSECGGKVSDKAGACPHCGAPVEKAEERKPLPERENPLPPKEPMGPPVALGLSQQPVPAEQPSSEPKGPPVGTGWFVLIPGKSDLLGPLDDEGVIQLIAEGTARGDSSLRRGDSKEWTDLKDMPEFREPFRKAERERAELGKWASGSGGGGAEWDVEERAEMYGSGRSLGSALSSPRTMAKGAAIVMGALCLGALAMAASSFGDASRYGWNEAAYKGNAYVALAIAAVLAVGSFFAWSKGSR